MYVKLRQVDVLTSQGQGVAEASREWMQVSLRHGRVGRGRVRHLSAKGGETV